MCTTYNGMQKDGGTALTGDVDIQSQHGKTQQSFVWIMTSAEGLEQQT